MPVKNGRLTCCQCGHDLGDAEDQSRDPDCPRCLDRQEREERERDEREQPATHTWTTHTFLCQGCKKVCYASQQAIDAQREIEGDPPFTDKEIAEGFDYCIGCVDGKLVAGEKVALQPLRVFVHESDARGWARWDANECDISECFPTDVDEAIRVRAELEHTGFAWVGGGAAQLYLITRKPGQLTDRPGIPKAEQPCPVCGGVNEGNTCCPPTKPLSADDEDLFPPLGPDASFDRERFHSD